MLGGLEQYFDFVVRVKNRKLSIFSLEFLPSTLVVPDCKKALSLGSRPSRSKTFVGSIDHDVCRWSELKTAAYKTHSRDVFTFESQAWQPELLDGGIRSRLSAQLQSIIKPESISGLTEGFVSSARAC